jgi:hypothetical protein
MDAPRDGHQTAGSSSSSVAVPNRPSGCSHSRRRRSDVSFATASSPTGRPTAGRSCSNGVRGRRRASSTWYGLMARRNAGYSKEEIRCGLRPADKSRSLGLTLGAATTTRSLERASTEAAAGSSWARHRIAVASCSAGAATTGVVDRRRRPISRPVVDPEQANGANGTRTRDLLAASQTLSQLSYGPWCGRSVPAETGRTATPSPSRRSARRPTDPRGGSRHVPPA